MIKKLKRNVIDLIFPPRCVGCGRLGMFICPVCDRGIVRIKSQSCPIYHKESPQGRVCIGCSSKTKLNGVVALGYFRDPILKEVIHQFKYEGLSAMGHPLAQLLANLIVHEKLGVDLVTYVPISRHRYNERGYNQAEVLAREISQLLGTPFFNGLVKTTHTKPQVGLRRKERLENVGGAFTVRRTGFIVGKRILVVDDVLTTGSTLSECARVLKISGAKKVWAVVLARE